MDQGGYYLHFLLVAFGEFLDFASAPVGEVEEFEVFSHHFAQARVVSPLEAPEKQYLVFHAHIVIEAAFLRHIPYHGRGFLHRERHAHDGYAAGVGR